MKRLHNSGKVWNRAWATKEIDQPSDLEGLKQGFLFAISGSAKFCQTIELHFVRVGDRLCVGGGSVHQNIILIDEDALYVLEENLNYALKYEFFIDIVDHM